jgi:hypothetical protein
MPFSFIIGLSLPSLSLMVPKRDLHPVKVFLPDAGPVCPRTGSQAVVARQGVHQNAKVGCALDVVVAAEDVGAATGNAHVAQGELQHAVGAGVVVAVGVLGATHAPDHGAGLVLGHGAGNALELRARNAGDFFNLFRVPLGTSSLMYSMPHTRREMKSLSSQPFSKMW